METKFTPGPWAMRKDGCVYSEAGSGIALLVKLISPWKESAWDGDNEALANSALIAAAPDLYAALESLLKTVVEDLGECGYDEDDIADHDGVKRAQEALKKARGE